MKDKKERTDRQIGKETDSQREDFIYSNIFIKNRLEKLDRWTNQKDRMKNQIESCGKIRQIDGKIRERQNEKLVERCGKIRQIDGKIRQRCGKIDRQMDKLDRQMEKLDG